MPLNSGIAQSITITAGFSSSASLTACLPSPASPTTEISESSSKMRRKPRRTSVWSSASSNVILRAGMCFNSRSDNAQPDQRSCTRSGLRDLQRSRKNLSAFPHRYKSDSALPFLRSKPLAAIFHFQLQRVRQKSQPDPGFSRSRMPLDVVERFLHDSEDVHAGTGFHRPPRAGLLIVNDQPGLPFHRRNIPIERTLQPSFFE